MKIELAGGSSVEVVASAAGRIELTTEISDSFGPESTTVYVSAEEAKRVLRALSDAIEVLEA